MSRIEDQTQDADAIGATLAARFGGTAADGPYGVDTLMAPLTAQALAHGFAAPLTDLGLLLVSGDEAAKFLHAQLTNDVEHLGEDDARLYGYCTAKGRMIASFVGWRAPDGIALALARPLAEPVRKRLSMFVLRSKAKVLDRSDDVVAFGIGGERAPELLSAIGIPAPSPMRIARADGITCAGMPSVALAGQACPRWLLVVAEDRADSAWSTLSGGLAPASTGIWRWTEVLAGVPRIVAGTSEQFVPQMVNYELIDGVSFKKGCYPGQEVVARSHYLGKLKRRMFAGHLDGADEPAPGSDVFPTGGGEPCGQVVMAAASPSGGIDLLFESQTAAIEAGVKLANGRPLAPASLPYPLPA